MVIEGAKSVAGVAELARRLRALAPIAEMVRAVVADGKPPKRAFSAMITEPAAHELAGILDSSRIGTGT